MTQNADTVADSPAPPPLRMRKPDGGLYVRPREVEASIVSLSRLPMGEVVERSRVEAPDDPRYVPTECILHFVRRPGFGDHDSLHDLFVILRRRVLQAVPVSTRRIAASNQLAEKGIDLEIRDVVLHKFQEMMCGDRAEYDGRLDFYECRFNSALARLRSTARRDVRRDEFRTVPMTVDGDSNEPSAEVEMALSAIRSPLEDVKFDFHYRSRVHVAISSLPPEERRVVELLETGLPIDSKFEDIVTIAKVVKCSEQTVRNRRDRAFKRIRDAMKEEET